MNLTNTISENDSMPSEQLVILLPIIMTAIIKKVTVVLNMPENNLDRLTLVKAIRDGIQADVSHYFTPGPTDPTITDYATLITDFSNKNDDVANGVPNAVEHREASWLPLDYATEDLRAWVQKLCRKSPDHAVEIAAEAHMEIKGFTPHSKQVDSAVSNNEGEIEITGRCKEVWEFHQYQVSTDILDPLKWLVKIIDPTFDSKITLTGYVSGSIVYIRHRVFTKDGQQPWCNPIKVTVK